LFKVYFIIIEKEEEAPPLLLLLRTPLPVRTWYRYYNWY